jgi:hypothetical protein
MIYWPAHVSTRRPCFTSPWEVAGGGEGCRKRAASTRGKKSADSTARSAQFAMDGFRSRTAASSCRHHGCLRSCASKSEACSLGTLLLAGFKYQVFDDFNGWAQRHGRLLKVIGFPSLDYTSCDSGDCFDRSYRSIASGGSAPTKRTKLIYGWLFGCLR